MIITHIMGGIGNQFFQYAFGRYLAHKHNTELKLDITECERCKDWHHNYYRLGEFNVQENFATIEEIKSLPLVQEHSDYHFDEKFLDLPDNIFLYGYWGKEKYFIEIRDILLRELSLKNPLGRNSAAWKEKILASNCAVSLHLRNGDYLTPLIRNSSSTNQLGLEYYQTCINELRKKIGDFTLFVFSDDLDCAKAALKFDLPMEFVDSCETDAEELYLMSICKHNIIYRSTFSWWGAWLNQNPNKIVLFPSYKKIEPQHIPERFVPVSVENNSTPLLKFPPMLSIIVYVENNLSTINSSLSSILSQDFSDYEIILLDVSTDGSGEICRQVASNKKVTLLTVESSATKFFAWNKALEVARGDYILFLTAKEFMFQNVTQNLAQFHYDYLKRYVETQGKYLSYANYNKTFPNLICTTQTLNEDEHGTVNIGLPDKKFSIQVDESFQNLNSFVETNFSSQEKLLALGTKQIDSSVDTKFFKRQFLNENNIRFREGGGTDAELTFVVESFLKTNKITFTPNPIIGRLK